MIISDLVSFLSCFNRRKISIFDMSNKDQNFTDNRCQGHFNVRKEDIFCPLKSQLFQFGQYAKKEPLLIYSQFLDHLLPFTITSLEMVSMTTSSTRPSIPCSWKGKWCRKGTVTRIHKNNGTYKVLKKKYGRQNATFQTLVLSSKFYENAQ